MTPPAFTTKSGAQTMPRSVSSPATSREASWLFAAPTTARTRSVVDDLGREHAAESARHEHVGLDEVRVGRVDPGGAELVGERTLVDSATSVTVSRAPAAARLRARRPPTWPRPAIDEVTAGDVGRAEDVAEGREDRGVHAGGGGVRGLADAALLGREAADVLGALVHDGHELGARADVFGGHVGAAERLDGVAEVEHGVARRRARRA